MIKAIRGMLLAGASILVATSTCGCGASPEAADGEDVASTEQGICFVEDEIATLGSLQWFVSDYPTDDYCDGSYDVKLNGVDGRCVQAKVSWDPDEQVPTTQAACANAKSEITAYALRYVMFQWRYVQLGTQTCQGYWNGSSCEISSGCYLWYPEFSGSALRIQGRTWLEGSPDTYKKAWVSGYAYCE